MVAYHAIVCNVSSGRKKTVTCTAKSISDARIQVKRQIHMYEEIVRVWQISNDERM